MLRALVVALLVANLAFFAWTQGWLDAVVGVKSIGDREPERLLRQVRPETIVILPFTAAASEPPPPPTPETFSCLEAGPFNDAELTAAQGALRAAVPEGVWADIKTELPGSWIVYMGRYADRALLTKKADELRRLKVGHTEVSNPPALTPGLSLGKFDDRGAADQALARFARQGIRTARVVLMVPPKATHLVRVEKADAVLAARLSTLKADALGKGFGTCPPAPRT